MTTDTYRSVLMDMAARAAAGVLLVLSLALCGCGRGELERPGPEADPAPAGPALSAQQAKELLAGTWDYGLKYQSGDVVPCVRVFQADGSGYQYAKEAGEAGKQSFRWELAADVKTLTLAYSATMTVEYAIEKLEPGTLVMTAQADMAFPEEHTKR